MAEKLNEILAKREQLRAERNRLQREMRANEKAEKEAREEALRDAHQAVGEWVAKAQGVTEPDEILGLTDRLDVSPRDEWTAAREALWATVTDVFEVKSPDHVEVLADLLRHDAAEPLRKRFEYELADVDPELGEIPDAPGEDEVAAQAGISHEHMGGQ